MDLIPLDLADYVVLQNATKCEWVWNLPLHSPVAIFFIHFVFTAAQLPWTPAASLVFFVGNQDTMKNNFSKSQTYFAIKLKIDENISYLLSYLQDSLTFKDVLCVSICGTASNSAVTKSIPYSVNPQIKQTPLIFWGYPKIFLFRKRGKSSSVKININVTSLFSLFLPILYILTGYYWGFMSY